MIAYVMERLLAVGALDVFTQSIGMKKSRSGLLLTVLCQLKDVPACEDILFAETTTLGIRRRLQERVILAREIHWVETKYGKARVKIAWRDRAITVQPEYADCAELAQANQVTLLEIQKAVHEAGIQLLHHLKHD
ncbi:nickel insertion protein [Thalassoporum mexicanum]|uniref:nickel insertion protein n=1 Tax=Thalassoporum mexicanum TaxID=3457544 RepID=UPI0002D515E1